MTRAPKNTASVLNAVKTTEKKAMSPQQKMKAQIQGARGSFTRALPSGISPERFESMVLTAVNTNPKLLECDPMSIIACAVKSAQLGLEPNTPLGQAYLIPYEDRKLGRTVCNFQPGYRGYITLAYKSGFTMDAHEVYAADEFEYEYGLDAHLKHRPALTNRKQAGEKPICYYATYRQKEGGSGFAVMSYEDVLEHAQKFSKTYNRKYNTFYGPWKDNFDAMAKKTVLLQLMKYIPMTPESTFAQAYSAEGRTFEISREAETPDIIIDNTVFEADYEEHQEEVTAIDAPSDLPTDADMLDDALAKSEALETA